MPFVSAIAAPPPASPVRVAQAAAAATDSIPAPDPGTVGLPEPALPAASGSPEAPPSAAEAAPPPVPVKAPDVPAQAPTPAKPAEVAQEQAPALGFLQAWPPKLPPFLAVEAMVGPRWGKTTTFFPAFRNVTASVGGTSVTAPDLTNPRLGQVTGEGGSTAGHLRAEARIPILSPSLAIDFALRGPAREPFLFESSPEKDAVNPGNIAEVLPSRTVSVQGRILGFGLGYRNMFFADGLPGLGRERTANLVMSGYDLGIGLGPVDAGAGFLSGYGWVVDGGTAVVLPAEVDGHLGVTVWGIKVAVGVRGEAVGFGGNLGNLLKALNPASLVSGLDSNPTATPAERAKQAQELARLSYTWGPYLQAGVAF